MKDKIEMTAGQKKEIKELVKGLCANYDRATGDCLLMDAACYQTCNFTGLCRYFENAVLPVNKVLHAQLVKRDALRVCSVCGKSFVAASNHAKYCDSCSKIEARKKATARKQRQRLNMSRFSA